MVGCIRSKAGARLGIFEFGSWFKILLAHTNALAVIVTLDPYIVVSLKVLPSIWHFEPHD